MMACRLVQMLQTCFNDTSLRFFILQRMVLTGSFLTIGLVLYTNVNGAMKEEINMKFMLAYLTALHSIRLLRSNWVSSFEPFLSGTFALTYDRNLRFISLDLFVCIYYAVAYNSLVGTIPSELGQLDELEVLALSLNNLSGPLPSEIGELIKLTKLNLEFNSLTGTVPSSFGYLTNLGKKS